MPLLAEAVEFTSDIVLLFLDCVVIANGYLEECGEEDV
jgi:hypothetical protein